jgi:DNA topoisomerase-1
LRTACQSCEAQAETSDEGGFTAKDFRTWAGSALALDLLSKLPTAEEESARKKNVVSVVESVAARLGNTPAVCRRCYIHPAILQAYMEGVLPEPCAPPDIAGLSAEEARLQQFLENLPATLGTGEAAFVCA